MCQKQCIKHMTHGTTFFVQWALGAQKTLRCTIFKGKVGEMNLFQMFVVLLIAFVCAIGAREIFLKKTQDGDLGEIERRQENTDSKLNSQLKQRGFSLLKKIGFVFESHYEQTDKIDRTKLSLVQCGVNLDTTTWYGIRVGCVFASMVLIGATLSFFRPEPKWTLCIGVLCLAFGFFMPKVYLLSKKHTRAKEMSTTFPSSLELLSCAVRSGYTIERGIRLVGRRCDGVIADEFKRVDKEINFLNMPLPTALERMKERCDIGCVTYFVNAMIQAHKQGTSIGRTLNVQAKAARDQYYTDTLVAINELPNKMIPVIFVVFFPIIIVLAVGPVIYNAAVQFMSIV